MSASEPIDEDSFLAALRTLSAEGCSQPVELPEPADPTDDVTALLAAVLRQIDGIIYEDPKTGHIVLKLIRADREPELISLAVPAPALNRR